MGDIPIGYGNIFYFRRISQIPFAFLHYKIYQTFRIPAPEIPTFSLLHLVAVDSIAITMVSYTITISMALIFAHKLNYKINSNQELLAMVKHLNL